ncbi:Heterokaryon incompatibility protein 6 OR allele [Lachnellula suecica]|uniref:Heterokaryon incompatibility protein 6 OR allele n=1 Tax=Lachnellula suecica TaxID=602035 RepID=A0A8T9CBI2_9HELO|nr:Heterokaryon incompatibility protein 6 OR allele [Lachnellula suecica]
MAIQQPSGSYTYQSLDTNKHGIRLVELLPAARSPQCISDYLVNCRIEHASLDNCPPYQALSYHWGDATVTWPIFLEGEVFLVTKNLEEALRCLIASGTSGYIWVDAICIDQANFEERAQQVQNMASIYENATRVLVWLGMGDEDTQAVFRRLKMAEDLQGTMARQLEERRSLRMATPAVDLDDDEDLPVLGRPQDDPPQISHQDVRSADKIFQHPWWDRVWVIQEATVARELRVVCGTASIPWAILSEVYGSQHAASGVNLPYESNLEPLRKINLLRISWRTRLEQEWNISGYRSHNQPGYRFRFLTTLLSAFRNAKATDPKDKIYAFLGLAEIKSLLPNYAISHSQLYTSFVESYCRDYNYDALDILKECIPQPYPTSLPSFVPDWTVSATDHSSFTSTIFNRAGAFRTGEPYYRASGNHDGRRILVQSIREPYSMNISGIVVDSVQATETLVPSDEELMAPLIRAFDALENYGVYTEAWHTRVLTPQEIEELFPNWYRVAEMSQLNPAFQTFLITYFDPESRLRKIPAAHKSPARWVLPSMALLLDHLYAPKSPRKTFTTTGERFGVGREDVRSGDLGTLKHLWVTVIVRV